MFKITKQTQNIPLIDVHNFCIMNDVEWDCKEEEIILLEVKQSV